MVPREHGRGRLGEDVDNSQYQHETVARPRPRRTNGEEDGPPHMKTGHRRIRVDEELGRLGLVAGVVVDLQGIQQPRLRQQAGRRHREQVVGHESQRA